MAIIARLTATDDGSKPDAGCFKTAKGLQTVLGPQASRIDLSKCTGTNDRLEALAATILEKGSKKTKSEKIRKSKKYENEMKNILKDVRQD